uniref:Uncharacterized protein n=1 Tax=Crocodylus porosus TaxID=8502 RepID=A0A7M4FP85_CROPO
KQQQESFKLRRSASVQGRCRSVLILTTHPTKILVVKQLQKEKHLPTSDQSESLVSLFIVTLDLPGAEQLRLPSLTTAVGEVDCDNRGEDSFLYLTYASQVMFGG